MTIHELPDDYIARFRVGDREAMALIIQLCYKRVYEMVFHLVQEKKEAEDIISDVFLKLWERREQFENREHINAFILKASRNAGLDWLRAKKRRKKAHREMRYLSKGTEPSQEQQIIRKEGLHELNIFLEALSPQRKEVIRLLFLDGMKVREVAARMGISPVTVQGHKAKALKKLRAAFSKREGR